VPVAWFLASVREAIREIGGFTQVFIARHTHP